MTNAEHEQLAAWEARCRSLGLLITSPRRAILTAMLQPGQPQDAVALLQAARKHYATTSIGTVYRLLRELRQLGLVHVQAQPQPHGRCRWRLHDSPPAAPEQQAGNIRVMLKQVQRFLRELEKLGYAELLPTLQTTRAVPTNPQFSHVPSDSAAGMLQKIAERFGYRLA